jgi:catechol 2,3-dioxygenase-like lactoylglutathione lyase family enzyme
MANRITAVVIDCADPESLAAFWTQVLGWRVSARVEGVVSIGDGPFTIDLAAVPEPKPSMNRLHLDVNPTDRDQEAVLERLLALGAKKVDVGQPADASWHVLADPEGNEFCLLRSRRDP